MSTPASVVLRMLGQHGEQRIVTLLDLERWISAGHGTDVRDEVIALLVLAASQHERAKRRALAASLRQHASGLRRPFDAQAAHLRTVDDVSD